MFDEYWNKFINSGSVHDYLSYVAHSRNQKAEFDENSNKGTCDKRTNDWRKR